MKFIYYNPETRLGYITDPLTPEDGEIIAQSIGYYMVMNIAAVLIAVVVIFPFIIVSGLDKFLISFLSVNKSFIVGTAIVLILIKFLTVRLSSTLIVRFLFALMVVIPILYILLYKFHMADITISIGRRFEISNAFLRDTTAQSIWVEDLLQKISSNVAIVFLYLKNASKYIDYTAFSSSLSTINIASILVCIGKTLLWWGLLILFSLLIFVVGMFALIILIGLPYFIAFGVLMLANNLIYRIKQSYARYLKV